MAFREAYLDNAATARPYPEVVARVAEVMGQGFGNASAEHARGHRAHALLEESRSVIARALGVDPSEVFFTSGGTESNNLAIRGAAEAARVAHPDRDGIVASAVEHPSVTKTVRGLKRSGWRVAYVGAANGDFRMPVLRHALDARTALITCMRVQNEMGYLMPVEGVVAARDELAPQALVHTDCVQAFGKVPVRPRELGVDLASLSGHKIGGPQGIGALYVKAGTPMFTTAFGGGQERGLRSGTEALPLIAGFAEAVRITCGRIDEELSRIGALKREVVDGVRALWPEVRMNSRDDGSPYIVCFSVPGLDNTACLDFLSERGVYVSKSSACETLHPNVPEEDWRTKHPMSLHLCGVPKDLTESTLRVSFSQQSVEEDVRQLLDALRDFKASADA